MKAQKFVRVLILLAILGIVMLPISHLIAESTEKKTESAEIKEKNSESTETSIDVEVNEETEVKIVESETKLKEAFEKLAEAINEIEELDIAQHLNKEKTDVDALLEQIKDKFSSLNDIEGVRVEISEPMVILDTSHDSDELKELKEKIQKLAEDGNLKSNEIKTKIKELVESLKLDSSVLLDKDNVKVYTYGPNVTTKILKDIKGNKELEEKIKELASDESLDAETLVKKVQELVKGMKYGKSVILDKDNVKVHTFGPYVTTRNLKDPKSLKKLGEGIRKFSSDENLDTAELAEKVIKLIHGMGPGIDIITKHGFEGAKVYQLKSSGTSKDVNDTKLSKLETRIEKLETRIEKLLEKLDSSDPESSEEK